MPETVLVTGGAGYVGSHVVVELARGGYAPVVLDNFANSTPAVLPRLEALSGRPVPWVNADLRDIAAVRRVFHDHPIAAVVHCAGLKSIDESEERPLAYYDVNVGGALAMLSWEPQQQNGASGTSGQDDMVIVAVNPIERDTTPMRASEISDRLNEITFNSALVGEIDQINLLNKL